MVAPTHWGVDSVTPSTFVKSKKTGKTFWQLTVDRFGRQPEFWGRYLNAGNTSLTSDEVDFLHASNCRIVPVFLIDPKNIQSEDVGKRNAQSAINLAKALNMAKDEGVTQSEGKSLILRDRCNRCNGPDRRAALPVGPL